MWRLLHWRPSFLLSVRSDWLLQLCVLSAERREADITSRPSRGRHFVLFINRKIDNVISTVYKKLYVLLCKPVEDRRRVRAILPYTKVPETDEIRLIYFIISYFQILYTISIYTFFFIEN